MKRYLVILTAIWLMLALAWVADAETMYVHVRDGTYLNGRRDPNMQSPILMTMGRGDDVEVTSVNNGWAEILGGEAGSCWCCVDYLADYSPDESAALYTVVSNGRVRVRQSPDGKAVGYARNGDTVTVRFILDGWAYIGEGYVMAEYLERREDHE